METPLETFYSQLAEQPGPMVLATIAAVKGSSPGKPGFKMVINGDGSTSGTVGGGNLEQRVIEDALKLMGQGLPKIVDYKLTEQEIGMWCGGAVTVLLEPLGPGVTLWIFGYGNLGCEVHGLVQSLLFKPVVVHEEKVPDVSSRVIDWASLEPFPEIRAEDFVLVLTMDADVELEILNRLSSIQPRYLGVIGSKRKGAKLVSLLEERGAQPDSMNIRIPVGVDISARSPKEIAVSIVAELIRERNA